MASYALSGKADTDILHIARTSIRQWGLDQAETHILGLHHAFQSIADFPDLGRDASDIREGYLRLDRERHSIFYRKTGNGILIIRILHERMNILRHL